MSLSCVKPTLNLKFIKANGFQAPIRDTKLPQLPVLSSELLLFSLRKQAENTDVGNRFQISNFTLSNDFGLG